MRRKNPARESAKKSGGSKIEIREKSVLPKAGPNNWATKVKETNADAHFGGGLGAKKVRATNEPQALRGFSSPWLSNPVTPQILWYLAFLGRTEFGVPMRFGRAFRRVRILKNNIRARKGIPKNLSSQVFGEVRVNFSV